MAVSLAHIVRLVPQYYVESGGKRMVTELEDAGDDAQASQRGLKRFFLILDALGGTFESHTATEKGSGSWSRCGTNRHSARACGRRLR